MTRTITEIREELTKLLDECSKHPEVWRFNYSLGESSGNCFGANWEDEKKLKNGKN